MVLINHLLPLIMSQLLLIHHHFQSLACREIQWEGEEKQIEPANKLAVLKKYLCKVFHTAIVTF